MSESQGSSLFPVLPLRDIVVFPHMIVPLFVGREKSVRALEEVMADDRQILLASQVDPTVVHVARDALAERELRDTAIASGHVHTADDVQAPAGLTGSIRGPRAEQHGEGRTQRGTPTVPPAGGRSARAPRATCRVSRPAARVRNARGASP